MHILIEKSKTILIRSKKLKRRLYVDGNTVYGIDEECLLSKRQGINYANRQDLDALWERYQEQENLEQSRSEKEKDSIKKDSIEEETDL